MTRLLAIMALAVLALVMPAGAAAADLPVVELETGKNATRLAPYIRYTTIAADTDMPDVTALLAQPLERIKGTTIHFGPQGIRTLVLLKVRNVGAAQGSWILTTGRGSLSYFRLYELQGDQLALIVDGTDRQAVRANLRTYQAFSTELLLDPGQEKVVLIDFLSENSTYLPLKINTFGTFFAERRANIALVSGVVVGALTLLLLNFLFFSITGFREFLWLAVAEGFVVLNTIHSEGYFTIFFLYDQPLVSVAVEQLFKCGFAAAMAQFARSFVKTSTYFPVRDSALKALILIAVTIIALQAGLAFYSPDVRFVLHALGWLITIAVALILPFVGYSAIRQFGFQLWPLLVGWGSLALFIVYSAIASMGIFSWLPINWHLAGPIALFETLMVTLALGLNLKKIQNDKIAADANYARTLIEKLEASEQTKRLAEEKAFALETVHTQSALLHASGHDSRQVILALNSAVAVLKRQNRPEHDGELVTMLESSAAYLNQIVSTTISGANIAATHADFVVLSHFRGEALVEPLSMMFKTVFGHKRLTLEVKVEGEVTIISDKPLLMRVLANLLSNSYKHTHSGGASLRLALDRDRAVIDIADTGTGMPEAVMAELNNGDAQRVRGDDTEVGTGSGFRSARRIIERLHGSLTIMSSGPTGTRIRIALPAAFAGITPVSAEDLRAALGDWTVLDFDDRAGFQAAQDDGTLAQGRTLALTYDDTTMTRGRLSAMVTMVAIKPPCRELLAHPLLAPALEEV